MKLCSFLPMAIELAAARVKFLSPQAILHQLSQGIAILSQGPETVPIRQQTLRNTLDWSYRLLQPDEQTLFCRLAVFAGTCSLYAIDQVCTFGAGFSRTTLELIATLVDNSVVQPVRSADHTPRFRLLDTMRAYAWEQLAASSTQADIQQRHAACMLAFTESSEQALQGGAEHNASLQAVEDEHENICVALGWMIEQGSDDALRIGAVLWRFWHVRGYLHEGVSWLEKALAVQSAPSITRAKVLNGLGMLLNALGSTAQAQVFLRQSAAMFELLGDDLHTALVMHDMATLAALDMHYDHAETLLADALARFRALGYIRGIGMALSNLGALAMHQGAHRRAITLLNEALVIEQQLADKYHIAFISYTLGMVHLAESAIVGAAQQLQTSLDMWSALGYPEGIAASLEGLAAVATTSHDYTRAARLWGAAEQIRTTYALAIPAIDARIHEPYRAVVCASLGAAASTAAEAEGRALAQEQVIAEAGQVTGQPVADKPATGATGSFPANLSKREIDVLRLVAEGLSNAEIAARLIISPYTINAHLRSIYRKIGVTSRAAATRWAFEQRLFSSH